MPIHTRSTTKKLQELGDGIYGFTSLSDTGEGIHTRFEYVHKFNPISDVSEGISLRNLYHVVPNYASHPLQRTSPQRWVRDPETGELFESNSWSPIIQAASKDGGRSEQTNEDEVFEREYHIAMQNRDYMADLTRKLIALDQLNEGLANDALQISARPPLVEEAPKARPLGPEGTELIDETFRALPGEPGVYPEEWVTHQSTLLRPQPTELNIMQ